MSYKNVNFCEIFINALCIAICTIIFWTLKSLFHKRKLLKFSRKHCGHRFYPIVGNGLHLVNKNVFSGFTGITKTYGTPCNLWIGHEYHYITADAREIKIFFNHPNCMEKGSIYENFKFILGKSLLLMPVENWKRTRKFCAKSFSQPILNSFVDMIYKKSQMLNNLLKSNNEINKFDLFQRYTFDTVVATVFGVDLKIQENTHVKLVEKLKELQDMTSERIMESSYYPTRFWIHSRKGKKALKIIEDCKNCIKEIIDKKRKIHLEKKEFIDNSNMLPLMDAMLESNEFSDEELFEESVLFITAATETSAFTLVFFFTLLGMNKEIQKKVYDEVIEVVGLERPILYTDLANLKYTERAIFEAMRIFPVTPILIRKTSSDIDIGTKIVPKDTNVTISVFDLHRNETYFENPTEFEPDRFLPEEIKKRENFGYTFIPFSRGPRDCIGKTYAIMLLKTAAANVLRNYEISSNYKTINDLKLCSLITMKTVNDDIDLAFINRHKNNSF